jgi:hypothetical protein
MIYLFLMMLRYSLLVLLLLATRERLSSIDIVGKYPTPKPNLPLLSRCIAYAVVSS